jgi:hypothetical protein
VSRQFDPGDWLERWLKVGGVQTGAAGQVCLIVNLDGNKETQQSLLSQLDGLGGRGRRDYVRNLVLERWAAS